MLYSFEKFMRICPEYGDPLDFHWRPPDFHWRHPRLSLETPQIIIEYLKYGDLQRNMGPPMKI